MDETRRYAWEMTAEEHAESWARHLADIARDRELSDGLALEWAADWASNGQAELQAA